jgi:hypothetical protein
MALFIALAAILFILAPTDALAWGVGVHLQLGSYVLANLQLLPPAVQAVLAAAPHHYLYGCISADITLGKKFTHYLEHCHSWRMGRKILEAAATDRQRACAYGYLAHLGADCVAHGYYVPYKMIRSFNAVLLKHAYWELRFEAGVEPEIWALADTLAGEDFREDDAVMRSVLSDTIFSFATNKRLFNSLLLLNRLQQWRRMLRSMAAGSKWALAEEDREEYLTLARQAAMSVLAEMEGSPFWKADPTGERALNAARKIRKNLNLLWLDGKLPADGAEAMLADIRLRLREGITRPEEVLGLLSGR